MYDKKGWDGVVVGLFMYLYMYVMWCMCVGAFTQTNPTQKNQNP